jgi:hypothetical protein
MSCTIPSGDNNLCHYHVFLYISHVLYSLSVFIAAIYLQSFIIYILAIHVLATLGALYSVSRGSCVDVVSP